MATTFKTTAMAETTIDLRLDKVSERRDVAKNYGCGRTDMYRAVFKVNGREGGFWIDPNWRVGETEEFLYTTESTYWDGTRIEASVSEAVIAKLRACFPATEEAANMRRWWAAVNERTAYCLEPRPRTNVPRLERWEQLKVGDLLWIKGTDRTEPHKVAAPPRVAGDVVQLDIERDGPWNETTLRFDIEVQTLELSAKLG